MLAPACGEDFSDLFVTCSATAGGHLEGIAYNAGRVCPVAPVARSLCHFGGVRFVALSAFHHGSFHIRGVTLVAIRTPHGRVLASHVAHVLCRVGMAPCAVLVL